MRVETDSLGSVDVPEEAYWGIHTMRAVENFPISGRSVSTHPELVFALAQVKQAAASANREVGALPADKHRWIDEACRWVASGMLQDQFVVDVVQGGAGTSTNMNANEVIANLALEIAGFDKGRYDILHPLDDVNRSQSTNDTYPTALRLAMVAAVNELLAEHDQLCAAFRRKGAEFADLLKVGRTQLQDAVPMTLGQEFSGFATTLEEDSARLRDVIPLLCEVNLGGTAIGTGITAHRDYAAAAVRHLKMITGLDLQPAADLIEASSDSGVFMTLSGTLKRAAIKLSKICNDLRLLSSGPQVGLGEINLPARQAGSSIMPGKVNPVIPEVVSQVAYTVAGADVTVTLAAEGGQLQLNAFEPVIGHAVLEATSWLRQACRTLRINCVDGITANVERLAAHVGSSVGVVTALVPHIGYSAAAAVAQEALATGRRVDDLVVERGLMTSEAVMRYVTPKRLSGAHDFP